LAAQTPQPTLGQSVNDYRRETLRRLKRTYLPEIHPLHQVQYRSLRSDALAALEPQLLAAVVSEANNPEYVPPGELKKVERLDEYGKVRCVEFVDQERSVKQMMRPGRRVLSFTTDRGRFDASGRALR
jgi:hypothetical protein